MLDRAVEAGMPAEGCSWLAACDRPPAVLRDRTPLVEVTPADLDRAGGHWSRLQSAAVPDESWLGHVSPDHLQTDLSLSDLPPEALPEAPPKALPETRLAMNLLAPPEFAGAASRLAGDLGAGEVIARIEASGLQGRGGAGFPAGFKWKAVRAVRSAWCSSACRVYHAWLLFQTPNARSARLA